ncbi:F1F0-ATPase inhibitor protein [Citrus sinensis]|nr:F1F0-ATPase inhibitor protein [Citrus sinensis]
MASRIAVRNFSRRFSSSGKVLSEEEKAAENVYIKFRFYMNAVTLMQTKVLTCANIVKNLIVYFDLYSYPRLYSMSEMMRAFEQHRLLVICFRGIKYRSGEGPKPEETPAASSGSGAEAKPTSAAGASTEKVSTDQYRNYAVIAGIITGVSALGWYLKSSRKKEQVQD